VNAFEDVRVLLRSLPSEALYFGMHLRFGNGAADLNHDGIITIQELYEYLEQQVSRKSRAAGGNQHPVMKGELEDVLPLVKIDGRWVPSL